MVNYKKMNNYIIIFSILMSSLLYFVVNTDIVLKVCFCILGAYSLYNLLSYLYIKLILRPINVQPKVIDSSAMVDGRIMEIIDANFMDGILLIPSFILSELHRLSDSESAIKRAKGRRALDLIDSLIKEKRVNVYIYNIDYTFTSDVDTKILTFAKEQNAKIITTDYNMSKVAKIHNIAVLNINKLANVMKSILLPDEEIEVELLKKGDKHGQAIGYLEDGTMIVVENASHRIGHKIKAHVTSTYPTPAGKMIFAKLK